MNDHTLREESDSDSEVESTGSGTEGWLAAAVGAWPAWLATVGAVALAAYFHLNESVWQTEAEIFYAEIFAIAAVAAVAYGVHEVRDRASPV